MWNFVHFEKTEGEIDINNGSIVVSDLLLRIEKEFPDLSLNDLEILPTKVGFTLRRKKTIGRSL